jgi:hypothetical protein
MTLSVSRTVKSAPVFSVMANRETLTSSLRSEQISSNSSFEIPKPSAISLKTRHKRVMAFLETTRNDEAKDRGVSLTVREGLSLRHQPRLP